MWKCFHTKIVHERVKFSTDGQDKKCQAHIIVRNLKFSFFLAESFVFENIQWEESLVA